MVHVFLIARTVVHVDELVLVVLLVAAAGRAGGGPILVVAVGGLARAGTALLLLHALVLGAPVLEPHFHLEANEGRTTIKTMK